MRSLSLAVRCMLSIDNSAYGQNKSDRRITFVQIHTHLAMISIYTSESARSGGSTNLSSIAILHLRDQPFHTTNQIADELLAFWDRGEDPEVVRQILVEI